MKPNLVNSAPCGIERGDTFSPQYIPLGQDDKPYFCKAVQTRWGDWMHVPWGNHSEVSVECIDGELCVTMRDCPGCHTTCYAQMRDIGRTLETQVMGGASDDRLEELLDRLPGNFRMIASLQVNRAKKVFA